MVQRKAVRVRAASQSPPWWGELVKELLDGHQVTCQPQEKFCAMRQNHNPQTRGMPLLGVSLASEACVLAKAVNVPVSLPWVLLWVLRAWP